MDPILHQVAADELPALRDWLHAFLPESHKLYATVRETILGRWRGTSFLTLGWPDILAAGEGPAPLDSPCGSYHRDPRVTSAYAPIEEHLLQLFLAPGFLDWSQPMIVQGQPARLRSVFEQAVRTNSGQFAVLQEVMMEATPDTLRLRPTPEGFTVRDLDPHLDTELIMSTWTLGRQHSDLYIRQRLTCFPSAGLVDKSTGDCIGREVGTEFGSLGLLHVTEAYRRRGLGKVVTSQLAHKYFSDGFPVFAMVAKNNDASIRMHRKCGFREVMDIDWLYYAKTDLKEYFKSIGFLSIIDMEVLGL